MSDLDRRLLETVRYPLAPNVKPGDQVVVITDTKSDRRVWHAIAEVVANLGAEPIVTLFTPRSADEESPPAAVMEMMTKVNLNVLNSTTAMYHSAAVSRAMASGVPCLDFAYGLTAEQLCEGGATTKIEDIEVWRRKIIRAYRGKVARLTSDLGTDLSVSIEGRERDERYFYPPEPYKVRRYMGGKLFGNVFPGGEVNVCPVEGTANGVVYVDTSIHVIKGWLKKPIKLVIKAGRIASVEGGKEADILRDYLEKFKDENAYNCPAELSVGCNPRAKFIGNQKEDKNVLGSVHVGIGTNSDVGGTILSKVHIDGVISKPTLAVDGTVIVNRGKVVA